MTELASRISKESDAMSEIIESVKTAELTPSELDFVCGGVSLNYSKIEMSYVPQNADGSGSQENHK